MNTLCNKCQVIQNQTILILSLYHKVDCGRNITSLQIQKVTLYHPYLYHL